MSGVKEKKSVTKNMNKKPSKGKSLRWKSREVKSAKKPTGNVKSEGRELDVDSLVLLDNAKERKKLNGIDEKIKFLKTELKLLLGGTDENSEHFAFKSNSVSNNLLNAHTSQDLAAGVKSAENWESLEESQTRELDPDIISTPLKFSQWVDVTVDEIGTKFKNEKPNAGKLPSSSEVQMDSTDVTLSPDSLPPVLRFGSSDLPSFSQQHVECLLYKSFLMQDSDLHLNSSEDNGSKLNNKKKKQNNNTSRKQQKKCSRGRRTTENYFSPCNRFLRRRVTNRKLNSSTCLDDIEVITLDSSSNSCKITNAECLDLDVSTYDWSEPFNINDETDIYSDVQIIEDTKTENDCINHEELNGPEGREKDRSHSSDETGEIQPKTVWECPVCFERSKGQEIVATQCGHVFCRKCLENHILKLHNNCPSCRCDLKGKPFITLFNL